MEPTALGAAISIRDMCDSRGARPAFARFRVAERILPVFLVYQNSMFLYDGQEIIHGSAVTKGCADVFPFGQAVQVFEPDVEPARILPYKFIQRYIAVLF